MITGVLRQCQDENQSWGKSIHSFTGGSLAPLEPGGKKVTVTLPYSSLTRRGQLAALVAVKTLEITPLPRSRQQSSILFYLIVKKNKKIHVHYLG